MREVARIALLLAAMVMAGSVAADELFVDVRSIGGKASDGNPGTRRQPFETINAALGHAGPGTTIFLRGGIYYETAEVVRGGTKEKPITIKPYKGEYVLIDGQNTRRNGILFPGDRMDFKKGIIPGEGSGDHVRIEGIRFANFLIGNNLGVAIQAFGRTGIVIKDVEIGNADVGVMLLNCSDCKIVDSEIHDCWPIRMLAPCHNIRIDNNEMYNGTGKKCYAVNVWGPADASVAQAEVASVRAVASGVMECTFKEFNAAAFKYYRENLVGLNGDEQKFNANSLIFYYELPAIEGAYRANPAIAGDIKGGEKLLRNDKESFVLANNPGWGNKPYSPDGTKVRFRGDSSLVGKLKKAKFVHIINTWNPEYQLSTDIHITNNRLYDSNCQGIQTSNTDYLFIKGNTIYDCGASGIQIEDNCHQVWIEDNEVYANSVLGAGECCIWIHLDKDVVVQNNRMYESQAGFKINSSERVLVRRNAIFNNKGQHVRSAVIPWMPKRPIVGTTKSTSFREASSGVTLSGGGHSGISAPPAVHDFVFVHNTLYNNGVFKSVNQFGSLMIGSPGNARIAGKTTFLNNIIYSDHNENLLCMYYDKPGRIDGNLYKGTPAARMLYCPERGGEPQSFPVDEPEGFEHYRQAFGQDLNSTYGEPLFANPMEHDFRLRFGSKAIDSGVALTTAVSEGEGTLVPVGNVGFFSAGYQTSKGEVLVEGDEVMVGAEKVRVVGVDWENSTLGVDRAVAWTNGQPVSYVYAGEVPDAGMFEYGFNK